MNDTNKELAILRYFTKNVALSSSEVASLVGEKLSLVTIKRYLSALMKDGYLDQTGAGRSVKYTLSKKGWLLRPYDIQDYLADGPDERMKDSNFEFDVFGLPDVELFNDDELSRLDVATAKYRNNAKGTDQTIRSKELMRFIVEFSWKTSQIEGNTYDLISTERLLLYGEEAPMHSQYEAQMIINQKQALEFIFDNLESWEAPKIAYVEKLHSIVAEGLDISKNLRKTMVGVTGTNYRPLGTEFQIREALEQMLASLVRAKNVYEQALTAVLGISYIQPFADGNKRTSRLVGNAMLLSSDYAPISYRSVDDRAYKEACLIFYEQNSIEPFKKLFIEQYVFAANNYNIARI